LSVPRPAGVSTEDLDVSIDIVVVNGVDFDEVLYQTADMSNSQVPKGPFKAKLAVILKANEVTVVEVEDANLWQQVFATINCGTSGLTSTLGSAEVEAGISGAHLGTVTGSTPNGKSTALFARCLGIDGAIIDGACSPSGAAPYLQLDVHCWEQMKNQLPRTGGIAISPIAASATLLTLWFREAGLGIATQSQAQAVLDTIKIRDQNASRGIKNTDWLQSRAGGQIVLNPAAISKAILFAKCFCSKSWKEWRESLAA
jgi:hypothetical protein